MKKRMLLSSIFVIVLLILFSGCSKTSNEQIVLWHEVMNNMIEQSQYDVTVTTKEQDNQVYEWTGSYDGVRTHTKEKKDDSVQEMYYSRNNGVCEVYVKNTDYDIWVTDTVKEDENMFYGYTEIERLRKISGWIDQGQVRYNEKRNRFEGSGLTGSYVYNGKKHHVQAFSIELKDKNVKFIKEDYYTEEDGQKKYYTDRVYFENIGTNSVQLPEDAWSRTAIESDPAGVQEQIKQKRLEQFSEFGNFNVLQ